MRFTLTPAARAFVREKGGACRVESQVVSGCCAPNLTPEVKPGPPPVTDGWTAHQVDGLTVWYDSLLAPQERLTIDLKAYGKYSELAVTDWVEQA